MKAVKKARADEAKRKEAELEADKAARLKAMSAPMKKTTNVPDFIKAKAESEEAAKVRLP